MTNWAKHTVAELKEELSKRKLPTNGLKKDLIERLTKDDKDQLDMKPDEEKMDEKNESDQNNQSKTESSLESKETNEEQESKETKESAEMKVEQNNEASMEVDDQQKANAEEPKVEEKQPAQPSTETLSETKQEKQEQMDEDTVSVHGDDDVLMQDDSPTDTIHVTNLRRPFSVVSFKQLVSQHGEVKSFWIDAIRTHAYITFESVEQASQAQKSLDGMKWPNNATLELRVEFVSSEDAQKDIEKNNASSSTSQRRPSALSDQTEGEGAAKRQKRFAGVSIFTKATQDAIKSTENATTKPLISPNLVYRDDEVRTANEKKQQEEKELREKMDTLAKEMELELKERMEKCDKVFMKTKTLPAIYYVPLTDEQVALKKKSQE